MNANQSSSVDLDLLAPFTSGDAIQGYNREFD